MTNSASATRAGNIATSEGWRAQLIPEPYDVAGQRGTEAAGTSPLDRNKRRSTFARMGCGEPLFTADAQFAPGTGGPSFDRPADAAAVTKHADRTRLMHPTEGRSARREARLGHVFPDGPREKPGRKCSGAALLFKPGGT